MARRIKYTKEILNSIKKGRDDIGDKWLLEHKKEK